MGRMGWLIDGMTVVLKLGALDDWHIKSPSISIIELQPYITEQSRLTVHLLLDRARVRKVIGIRAVAPLEQALVRMRLLVRWKTVLGGCCGVAAVWNETLSSVAVLRVTVADGTRCTQSAHLGSRRQSQLLTS
jgi:hypothetical protein